MNSLIEEQMQQQETLAHVISILTITRYTIKVNRHMPNGVMDALQKANEGMNTLLNVTDYLMQHVRYHQIYMHANTTFADLRDCLTYMRQVTTQIFDHVDATTTNILSPDIFPIEEL